MQIVKISLVVSLLLTMWGCSSSHLPDYPGPITPTAVAPCLDSPLLAHAEALAKSTPDKNYVRLLEIGNNALLARIHLIRSARRSIEIQTMIWANDETGRLIMFELIQAARRGVKVRLIIDHLASEQHIDIANFLGYVNPNFQIKMFNPVTGVFGQLKAEPSFMDKLNAFVFKFDRLNRRMHNKTFIIDDLVGITGGRNYQNAYYDQAKGMNYKDRDILVAGPVAADMKRSFDRYWDFKRSVNLTELVDVKEHHRKGVYRNWHSRDSFALNGLFAALDRDADRSELISQLFVESLRAVDHASFIADDPRSSKWSLFRSNGRSEVTLELAKLVSQATQSVYIQTPYLVLTSPAINLFKTLRQQHPDIDMRISTNSLAATDSWYVYALSYKQKQTYLSVLGFDIYEFKPLPGDLLAFMPNYEQLRTRAELAYQQEFEQEKLKLAASEEEFLLSEGQGEPFVEKKSPYFCMHAKSLVVDAEVAFVGSYNLDPRSENINTESGLVVRDLHFSRLLRGRIETDMQSQNSWVIAQKQRLIGIKEANSMMVELSSLIPLIDIWPFRYSASFELIDGKAAVETDHPDFYKNYRDVGNFPRVRSRDVGKEVGARGTKMFLGFIKPLL
jgi:phosphatidylserine/phosphatidylglycerophosphate/cardiolipin synthase-like enzyme